VNPLASAANWGVVGATAGVIALVVGMHYEVLRACIRYLPTVSQHRRQRVVVLIFVILVTHAVEIWVFAIAYYALLHFDAFGAVAGSVALVELVDYVYFSAMVYTTVGFGDLVPTGPIRFMTGMEALTGLVMITWSASFTFLEMQRDWPRSG
jgi:hypothetical protein